MEKTLIFLQKMLDCTTGIQFARVAYSEPDLLHFLKRSTQHVFDTLMKHDGGFWQHLLKFPMRADTIYEFLVLGGVSFLSYADAKKEFVYFLGPTLTKPFSQDETLKEMRHYQIPESMVQNVLDFCSSLPVVAVHTLYRTGELVMGYLTGREKPMKTAQANVLSAVDDYLLHPAQHQGEDVVQMRKIEQRYEYSAALTEAIKQGNFSLAFHLVGHYNPGTQTTVRNANPLRNAQNYCIVLNTQLRHALEECGIHPYQVDKLSNEIGLEIEQLSDISKLQGFFIQVIRRYCRLVQEHAYPDIKPLTNLAVTYIKEHLSENLTVKETAVALGVNANYLSTQFHENMGVNFISFLHQERSKQAAALLKHTNLQIQQIASIVGYNNTSYFTKQFLRFMGMNPSDYRKLGTAQ